MVLGCKGGRIVIASSCVAVLTMVGGIICYSGGGAIDCAYPSSLAEQYFAPSCAAPGNAGDNSPSTQGTRSAKDSPGGGDFMSQVFAARVSPELAGSIGIK